MKKIFKFLMTMMSLIILFGAAGCNSGAATPKELLDRYFSSAIKKDYATTYACYYDAYKKKVSREDFVKHRGEASVLQSYKIASLKQDNTKTAHAEVLLTFAPSEKLKRTVPVSTTVKEEMVKEGGDWKIKVW